MEIKAGDAALQGMGWGGVGWGGGRGGGRLGEIQRNASFTLGFAVESEQFSADEGQTSTIEVERRSRVCL